MTCRFNEAFGEAIEIWLTLNRENHPLASRLREALSTIGKELPGKAKIRHDIWIAKTIGDLDDDDLLRISVGGL